MEKIQWTPYFCLIYEAILRNSSPHYRRLSCNGSHPVYGSQICELEISKCNCIMLRAEAADPPQISVNRDQYVKGFFFGFYIMQDYVHGINQSHPNFSSVQACLHPKVSECLQIFWIYERLDSIRAAEIIAKTRVVNRMTFWGEDVSVIRAYLS